MISLTPADLADERAVATPKPVAVFHWKWNGDDEWQSMACLELEEVACNLELSRNGDENFYIEWTGALLDDTTLNTEVQS